MRLLRLAFSVVALFVALSLVIAAGRPETGPIEKAVLVLLFVGVVVLTRMARRVMATRIT